MTTGASASQNHPDLFVADFYPQFGEYLAEQHATVTTPVPGERVSWPGSASTRTSPWTTPTTAPTTTPTMAAARTR